MLLFIETTTLWFSWKVLSECGPSAAAEYFKQKHPKVSLIAGESMEKSDMCVLS